TVLMLRGNVELRMIRHPALSLVFQLEYVFSVPIAGDKKCADRMDAVSTSVLPFSTGSGHRSLQLKGENKPVFS
ncbi:nephrocystin-4 isoform X1, partial [Tachysurus ichikawai]